MTRAVTLANLADQNIFTADGTNDRVGIGSTQPTVKLDVTGDGNVSGTLTATSFSGDGTGLTGVASTDNIITGTAATFTNNVNISGITTVGVLTATQVNVTGVSTFVGFVAFTTSISVGGTVTYEDVTNIDSVGVVTARSGIRIGAGQSVGSDGAAAVFYGDGSNLTGVASTDNIITGTAATFTGGVNISGASNINVTGIITASAGVQVGAGQSFGANGPTAVYYGDGSNLTGIAAGITTTKYSPTANAIIQIGLGTAQHHELTLTAGFTTITTSGGSFGESHSLVLIQPSSGIATVGFSTFFQFPSGATPSMSEGSSKVDLVSFVVKDIAGNTGTGATELLASAGLNYS